MSARDKDRQPAGGDGAQAPDAADTPAKAASVQQKAQDDKNTSREDRLAEALRANLRRRKSAARERKDK